MQCRRPTFNPWVGKIPCRMEWLRTPVFLPGEPHAKRSLAGCPPWGHKESDTTEQLSHAMCWALCQGFLFPFKYNIFSCFLKAHYFAVVKVRVWSFPDLLSGKVGILHLMERQGGNWCPEPPVFSRMLVFLDTSQCELQLECDGNYFSSLAMLCVITSSEWKFVNQMNIYNKTKQKMLPLGLIIHTDCIF